MILKEISEGHAFVLKRTIFVRLSGAMPNNGQVEVKCIGWFNQNQTLQLDTRQVTDWFDEKTPVMKAVLSCVTLN